MKDFYSQQGAETRKFYQAKQQQQKVVGYCRVTFFQGMAGFYETNYLTSADYMITG